MWLLKPFISFQMFITFANLYLPEKSEKYWLSVYSKSWIPTIQNHSIITEISIWVYHVV